MLHSMFVWSVLALLLFWAVGLYNRLMRMRARGLDGLGVVAMHLREYAEVLAPFLGNAAGADADVPDDTALAWNQLTAALQEVEQRLKDAKAAPLDVQPVIRMAVACDSLQREWKSLCRQRTSAGTPAVALELQAQWESVTVKFLNAQSGLNLILTQYNEAIDQFPARLVAGIMGFKAAGLL